MKRLVFLLPAVLFLTVSCKQTYFIAEDDVYSMPDAVTLRPRSADVKPEASYDGYIYQQENGSAMRSGYFDPNTDENTNGETRVINNYYINNGPNMGWYGRPYRMSRWHRPGFHMGHGWGPSWGYSSFGWGNSWHNPWGPSWGYNPWGPSYGWNSWGYNPWGPSWGMQPWGMNPYGYYHQPWGGHYGMWGHHGGHWGNGWGGGYHNWYSAPANNSGGFASGNNGASGFSGPRPTHAGNQNPVNMGVGRGNASPIDAGGRPTQQAVVSNGFDNRGVGGSSAIPSGRDSRPVSNNDRTTSSESPVLVSGSSPWNPRVDAPARAGTPSSPSGRNTATRPNASSPGAVTVERGTPGSNANSTRPNSNASTPGGSRPNTQSNAPARPSGQNATTPNSTRPSGTVSPGSSRPTNANPAPSRQPSTSSPSPSRQPSTSSPSPSRSSGASSPGSSRPSGGSVGTSGSGRSGGSSGGSSGGGRPR